MYDMNVLDLVVDLPNYWLSNIIINKIIILHGAY